MSKNPLTGGRSMIVLATLLNLFCTSPLWAMRYSPAKILLDGKVVLECGGGDDGEPDVDEVWDTLKTRRFAPAADFSILNIPPEANEFTIRSDAPAGELGKIEIDVAYGGTVRTRSLHITRVKATAGETEWMVDAKDVRELADGRTISRESAAYLMYPENIRRRDHCIAIKRQRFAEMAIGYTAPSEFRPNLLPPFFAGIILCLLAKAASSRLRLTSPKSNSAKDINFQTPSS